MRLVAYLKIALKGIIKQLPSFILIYAIYPIAIALLMSFVQKDMFVPVIENPIFSIIIQDEDNTPTSKNLIHFLKSEEISKLITVKNDDNEEFDYTLRIPQNYEESLIGKTDARVQVEAEAKSSTRMGNILVNIIDEYNDEMSKNLIIKNKLTGSLLSEEKRNDLEIEINEILGKAYGSDGIHKNIHDVVKSLNSYEYYSITFLNFLFIIFISSIINSDVLEKEVGRYSRIMSTTITKYEYFNLGLMSNYLTMIVANIIYVGAYRLSGLSFTGSLPLLILIVLVQSFLITIIGTLISNIFGKKYGLPLVQIVLFYQLIFGGMMGPLEKMGGNPIFLPLAKFKPDILISNSYRNYLINNNLGSISNYLLMMLIISLGLYLVNILAIRMKWGVSK